MVMAWGAPCWDSSLRRSGRLTPPEPERPPVLLFPVPPVFEKGFELVFPPEGWPVPPEDSDSASESMSPTTEKMSFTGT